ncbi:MAG: Rho termination factor N-terminal domain-containing protein, partial [Lachnospiraceae bacterium]|nr:Rho termination factor N-terminal domain-containing protein [Lachnospiraceae bacterium]
MREKYESLPLAVLRDLAKARGLKGTSAMKKSEVVEAMLEEDERLKQIEEKKAQAAAAKEAEQEKQAAEAKTEAPAKRENSAKPDSAAKQRILRSMPRQEETTKAQPAERQQATTQTQPAQQVQAPAQPVQQATPAAQAAADAGKGNRQTEVYDATQFPAELDSGIEAIGILEVMPDGYGFIRGDNYLPGENDVYVAPSQIRRFGLKTGDILRGNKRIKTQQEKFSALLYVRTINGYTPEESAKRMDFSDMTPIFPDKRIKLETPGCSVAMRVMDLVSPVGKGQRG